MQKTILTSMVMLQVEEANEEVEDEEEVGINSPRGRNSPNNRTLTLTNKNFNNSKCKINDSQDK
jgi:hypothetical protein